MIAMVQASGSGDAAESQATGAAESQTTGAAESQATGAAGSETTGPAVVVTATRAERDRVIATVVAAFHDDPAFRYFFRDPATFVAQAAAFAAYLFDRRVDRATVWTIAGGAAVAMWDAPTIEPAAGDGISSGDLLAAAPGEGLLRGLSADALARLDAYDAAVHDALPTTPHWYLGVLATDPAHAGRRWGRAAMARGLAEAAGDHLPSYLETTKPANVALYERAGWEVAETRTVDDLNVWIMRHSA